MGFKRTSSQDEKSPQGHVTVVNETKTCVLNFCFKSTKISDPTKIESLETDLKNLWDLETLGIIQKENLNFWKGRHAPCFRNISDEGHYIISSPYHVLIQITRVFETKKRENLLHFKRERYLKLFGRLE